MKREGSQGKAGADIHTHRQTNRQIDRQTDKQTDGYCCVLLPLQGRCTPFINPLFCALVRVTTFAASRSRLGAEEVLPLMGDNALTNPTADLLLPKGNKGTTEDDDAGGTTPDMWLVFDFSEKLDQRVRSFDDAIMGFLQQWTNRGVYWCSMALTVLTCIEVGVCLPFIFYVTKQDATALEFTLLGMILCIVSQVPKRFVWRPRPWMLGRARALRRDKSSSFPSRAVTCAVVYSFAAAYAYNAHNHSTTIQWWMIPLVVVSALLTACARIHLGVHYPTDCVAGGLVGFVVCMIATGILQLEITGCTSCETGECYTPTRGAYDEHNLDKLNWGLAAGLVIGSLVFVMSSIMPPLHFWDKCGHVYGLLLPCLVFHLLFLCPKHSPHHMSLPEPKSATIVDFVWALSIAGTLSAFGMKARSKIWCFLVVFPICLLALCYWRLARI